MKHLGALILVLVACAAAFSQTLPDPGAIPAFSSVEAHPYDNINLATLAIQLNVPVRSKIGHIPFSFLLQGNSQGTYTLNYVGNTWRGVYSASNGWLLGREAQMGGSAHYTLKNTYSCAGGQLGYYSNWLYTDPSGVVHPVDSSVKFYDTNTCGFSPTSGSGYTTDGSGIYVYISSSNGTSGYAIDTNGIKTTFEFGNNPYGTLTDPNGNQISGASSNGTYTDTLGQTALVSTYSYGSDPLETDTWTDAAGNNQSDQYYTQSHLANFAFGCAWENDTDWPTAAVNFSDHVLFPDGSQLKYSWEVNQVNSSYYTGRLASITLPQGGQISYAYSGGTNGVDCTTGMPVTLKRTTPDGIWTYTRATNGWTNLQTTVTDPAGNKFVYTFASVITSGYLLTNPNHYNYMVAEKDSYTGSTITQKVITCYNNPSSTPTNCNPSSLSLPITEKDEYTTYAGMSGYSAVKTILDSYGRITDVKTYDYGLVLVNEKQIQYGSGNPTSQACSAISTYIIGKPCSVTVLDSQHSNAIISQTWNSYDSNGNLLQTWDLVKGSGATGTYLTKSYTYSSQGVMQTSVDVNGETTYYTTTSCNNMLVTSQTVSSFTKSQIWDCNGGVVTSVTDENSQTMQTVFDNSGIADPFYRPVETIDELGNVTTLSYTPTSAESVFLFNGGASVIDTLSTTDNIGRPVVSQLRQGPSSSNWDTKSRSFDSDGRLYQTSLPCVQGAGTSCSASTESQNYEALNRHLVHTGTGGDVVTKAYNANDVLTTLTPAPTGENAKAVQKEFDGLGRLKSECLISSATGSSSCGQTTSATGFLTNDQYDAVGHLLSVTENAQVSSPQQTRSYSYDFLGRLLTEINPEIGGGTTPISYYYDSAPDCANTSPGDLIEKKDPRGNISCYTYDGLHRNTRITYSGPDSNSIEKHFVYDSAAMDGHSMAFANNRLAETYTCYNNGTTNNCPPNTVVKITDEGFSYDQRGQLATYYQSSPNSAGYYVVSASHWEDGATKSVSGLGLPTITYGGLDGERRVQTVTASAGTNPASGVTYNNGSYSNEPIGALLSVTLGNGDSQNFTFYQNTGRMKTYSASVGATPTVITGTLSWNSNGTLGGLSISDGYNSGDTQNCSYAYDDFIRAASVNCTNGSTKIWNQTFTFGTDAFGNLSKSSTGPGVSFNPGYNATNNHYTSLPGVAYDSNGNLLNDSFHAYTWIPDGHVASIDSSTIVYDAQGNKVEENVNGVIHEYVSIFGVSAQMSGQTETAADVVLPGGVKATYSSGSLVRFRFPDWQMTIRAESNATTRAFTESLAFAPFGERYAVKGTPFNGDSFTGMPDQIVTDEYDFKARELQNASGRWTSPDPIAGTGNKYVYADNNPLAKIDPYGLISASIVGGFAWEFMDQFAQGGPEEKPITESDPNRSTQTPAQTDTAECFVCKNAGQFEFGGGGNQASQTAPGQHASNVSQQTNNAEQQLGYTTISGGPNKAVWIIQFHLSHASASGGPIIQHVIETDASGNVLDNFWEAWGVPKGSQQTEYAGRGGAQDNEDDTFWTESAARTVHSEARFYEGLVLPSSFMRNNPRTPAGDLPSTTVDPHLPTTNATAPVVRDWTPPE